MPKPPLPAEAATMLAKPNPCVVATLRGDGAPVSTATWYLYEDGRVLLNMDASRVRLGHLRRDPRLSVTVLDDGNWYTHVSLLGTVAELREDEDLADIDRIARHYTGKPYADRERHSVTAVMEIERWHAWGKLSGGN